MNIRSFEIYDEIAVRKIHRKHYQEEFDMPDFFNKYECAFTIEDEQGILSMGGVKPILETVIVTDKDRNPQDRMKALYQMLEACAFVGNRRGYDQLHAFIHDPKWSKRLQKSFQFRPTKGQSLILDI